MNKKQKQNIHIHSPNVPILYTDTIFMNVNDDGVVIDVCQKEGENQYQIVSRIGMSKEQAKKFVKRLSEILALTHHHTHTTNNDEHN